MTGQGKMLRSYRSESYSGSETEPVLEAKLADELLTLDSGKSVKQGVQTGMKQRTEVILKI